MCCGVQSKETNRASVGFLYELWGVSLKVLPEIYRRRVSDDVLREDAANNIGCEVVDGSFNSHCPVGTTAMMFGIVPTTQSPHMMLVRSSCRGSACRGIADQVRVPTIFCAFHFDPANIETVTGWC